MVNLIGLVIGTFVVTVIGGLGGYWLWLKTRPKKETWRAKVYQLSEGVRRISDLNGEILSDLQLQDLRPYAEDVLEKVTKGKGITVWRLQKLNLTTPAVDADVVDYWGNGNREVTVLVHKGSTTLLKKGYDKKSGEQIFNPMSRSRIDLIKSEMAIRKDRLQKEKDILQAISPWIVAGICMIGLVAIAYVQVDGFISVSENLKEASANMASIGEQKVELAKLSASVPSKTKIDGPSPGEQPPTIE